MGYMEKIDKAEIENFAKQAEAMYKRLEMLHDGNISYQNGNGLPQVLVELGNASQLFDIATEELYQQNEELLQTRELLEADRQRYQDLFERYQDLFDFAPDCYLVTDIFGTIRKANRVAGELFNISQQHLLSKPMINFVSLEERQRFRSLLLLLTETEITTEIIIRFQQRGGVFFDAACKVKVACNHQGKAIALRWLIRDITQRQQSELRLQDNQYDLSFDRPVHKYYKGEVISLHPQVIWYVKRGVVKLSTLYDTGEELLTGIAAAGMVFGANMTNLNIYQATTMCDVELASIHQAEINSSPTLNYVLLPKINQRLRQTESFLVIGARRRVEDRLAGLLKLLNEEIGEKTDAGSCLCVRWTHEELASACNATRVTITRFLGKFQQQGKITFDANNRIIVSDSIDN